MSRWDVAGIPKNLDGVPVQVVVTGKLYAWGKPVNPGVKPPKDEIDPTARFDRPVPIGVSTGHPDITAGTIGCRVTDGVYFYALSNNHVYANENSASISDVVLQPGTYDGGTIANDAIGTLDDFEQIYFDGSDNTIDAAIAFSSKENLDNATPADGYGTPKSTTIQAEVNQPVKKYGRTTGLTKGRVYGINATVDINYNSGVARFVSQIIITPGSFSAGGDSGSLVVIDGKGRTKGDDRKAVGLLFAGSDLITIANPISEVLDRFIVTIDGD
ncbi:MAG: serine protease [Deltaproteobacteria bacterium]|nr:serine protease [Deltaproteobacteria bacterium]